MAVHIDVGLKPSSSINTTLRMVSGPVVSLFFYFGGQLFFFSIWFVICWSRAAILTIIMPSLSSVTMFSSNTDAFRGIIQMIFNPVAGQLAHFISNLFESFTNWFSLDVHQVVNRVWFGWTCQHSSPHLLKPVNCQLVMGINSHYSRSFLTMYTLWASWCPILLKTSFSPKGSNWNKLSQKTNGRISSEWKPARTDWPWNAHLWSVLYTKVLSGAVLYIVQHR